MVSRRQGLKYGQARRHARAEADRLYAPLQIGQALFERLPIGIVNPAIEEMPGELSIRIAFKSGGGVERRSDRAGGRVHMPPGVDAKGLKLLVRIRLSMSYPEFITWTWSASYPNRACGKLQGMPVAGAELK